MPPRPGGTTCGPASRPTPSSTPSASSPTWSPRAGAIPTWSAALAALVARTAATKRTLVHGDVSPKNILVGPRGPIFLDAECAWYGDPAFDLAFCLNHLLLKCLWTPSATEGFLAGFDALASAYLDGVQWEPRAALERRAAHLLPGLLLARVDGKSPVEYLTAEADRECVRRMARPLILRPADTLDGVRGACARRRCRDTLMRGSRRLDLRSMAGHDPDSIPGG